MLVTLAVIGAIVIFAVGWLSGRATIRASRAATETERDVGPTAPTAPAMVGIGDVLDDFRAGVALVSATGTVSYRNAALRSLVGTHVGVLLDAAIERRATAALAGSPSQETVEMYGPPRTVHVVEARPMRVGGAVVVVEDVSERRRIDQMRTDFVANISHELKTPVGAMSVLAETLDGEEDRLTIQRVVERMMAEADRASRTIDDLMELSRIELQGERADEPVVVADVVAAAFDRVREMTARRGVGLTSLDPVDGGAGTPVTVRGDRRQLVSAVGNLVENAVKYSSDGAVVQVRTRYRDGWVEIAVIDQGVGIPQRDLDRIFERFYRVDRARSRATGGTGLGLSIVRHVANHHGGEVRVTSTEGEGSTFVLRLPADAGADESPRADREGVA